MKDSSTARALRAQLVAELEQDGSIRTEPWRRAVSDVPRHLFVPAFCTDGPGPDGITRYTPVPQGTGEWLTLAYRNRTWVTQLDHGATSTTDGPVTGTPTSSSTLPGVVVRMLEDLEVGDDSRVLEVGTGTGYSTALLCARVGPERVASVEFDPGLSRAARDRLESLGYRPRLMVGDGALGAPAHAPFERIIATYSPGRIPAAWLEQSVPGAVILASLAGSLDAYGYVRLDVRTPERAEGRFIDGRVSFMLSRGTRRPALGPLLRAALDARRHTAAADTAVHPAVLDETGLLWAVQLALPGVTRLTLATNGGTGCWLLHPDGSWAVLESAPGGGVRVCQGGPRALWSTVEAVVSRWLGDGRPGLGRYGLTVTPEANSVWLDTPDRPVGVLAG
ncbi:ATP-grasp peptide maturase system methyltransferase [Peterkaempfera bronchialis]|uniref:Protein-L-isoaspartate O-methyltransferase n=1 Tax=Peterkaempfera bronchialis TaxID=2126346 RepID=A0A345SZL2_9ACTN|nr:ATP-grasp peptide maturase system methyltransferase [Peterkaempfera bronchialis]AXI79167.1 hypothetical protein C7M71_018865 [Peterkaempfera bronchialis]